MSIVAVGNNDEDDTFEERNLIRFAQYDEFMAVLMSNDFYPGGLSGSSVVTISGNEAESSQSVAKREVCLTKLTGILDEYQEQSYLLDPYLEVIVTPVVKALQDSIRLANEPDSVRRSNASQLLCRLLYHYTKVRGYKTISHFFPHTVHDLLPTLELMEAIKMNSKDTIWEMRYILLLWLSLICIIPFDLEKFDQERSTEDIKTAFRIQEIGKHFLASPGKERDAASVLLSKLFQRKDASDEAFKLFLAWARGVLVASPEPSIFLATGVLQTLCAVIKAVSPEVLASDTADIRSVVSLYSMDVEEVQAASRNDGITQPYRFSSNSTVNRYKAKMASRMGMKLLRPRKKDEEEEDEDVPEEIDGYIANLLAALQDKDTIVRYSAAKGISRLCSRLPTSFVDQVSEAITELFSINIVDILGSKEDLSNVSEFTWQGCCLALAELARRGLLSSDSIVTKLEWVDKALTFDVRRGAHSVGTGVRDAACYVLWAIARAHKPEAIKTMANQLSNKLVCVALLDRDISIRRAASAAYQECVGRLGLFEHGIDVIRITDFYAVGNRRTAFLDCTAQVAVHAGYREALLDHLLKRTILHWDPAMRELGASAIAKIASLSLQELGPSIIQQLQSLCKSGDSAVLHGALFSLAEMAQACSSHDKGSIVQSWLTDICGSLHVLPRNIIRPRAPSIVIRAACRLLQFSVTKESLQNQSEGIKWYEIIDAALKRQEEDVQIAAAEAMAVISHLQDCTSRIEKVMAEWKSLNISQQQSNARMIGRIHYKQHASSFEKVIQFLVSLVKISSPNFSTNVETRRNSFESMYEATSSLNNHIDEVLNVEQVTLVLTSMLAGLDDYTNDARGDVGSWVRLACLSSMRKILFFLIDASRKALDTWLGQSLFKSICAGYCKQMVERIDGVRAIAASECLLISSCFGTKSARKQIISLTFPGLVFFETLFQRDDDNVIKEPAWLLPRVTQLLLIEDYRKEVLKGIVLCIGGQKEMTNWILAKSLTSFLHDRPSNEYHSINFASDLVHLTMDNLKSNRYFIPCIQTFNILFEEDIVEMTLRNSEVGKLILKQALELSCRNIKVVKSVSRVIASSQLTSNMISVKELRAAALLNMPAFLLHTFPTVRSSTAEYLYIVAQDHLENLPEEAEDILLSTPWAQTDIDDLLPIVNKLMACLQIHSTT